MHHPRVAQRAENPGGTSGCPERKDKLRLVTPQKGASAASRPGNGGAKVQTILWQMPPPVSPSRRAPGRFGKRQQSVSTVNDTIQLGSGKRPAAKWRFRSVRGKLKPRVARVSESEDQAAWGGARPEQRQSTVALKATTTGETVSRKFWGTTSGGISTGVTSQCPARRSLAAQSRASSSWSSSASCAWECAHRSACTGSAKAATSASKNANASTAPTRALPNRCC